MEAFDVLGDPVRRRILELLAQDELAAGEVAAAIGTEFGISQPAVSQHLRVLRESGFATVRPVGTKRLYSADLGPLIGVENWMVTVRRVWDQRLDALGTELARGARQRRGAGARRTSATKPAAAPKAAGPRSRRKP